MKRKAICFVIALVCVCFLGILQVPAQVNASSYIKLNATAISKTQVKLSWKKKSVSSYNIYRATVNKNDSCGKFKKIATLSKSKVSYTDKVSYKQQYCYRIYGYKNGKQVYHGEAYVYSGVPASNWDEYQFCDAKISPTAIPLTWYSDNGLKPTGYEIYRSENGKTYKKLKTLQRPKTTSYTDKTVQAKHTYYYKVRAYRTMSGKKVYGKYSESVKHCAVNQFGIYELKPLTDQTVSPSAVSVAVTSATLNGTMTFKNPECSATCTFEDKDETAKKESYPAKMTMYSLDGNTWKDIEDEKTYTVKAGETIYLRFFVYDEQGMEIDLTTASSVMFEADVTYNGFASVIQFAFPQDNSFKTDLIGEYYH